MAWTDDLKRDFIKCLLNHTVAICGTYEYTFGDDLRERAYAYSGCVVASANYWHVLTAGHAIKDHIAKCQSGRVRITGRVLADCFGEAAVHREPLPFDPVTRVTYHRHTERGLDYAVFTLRSDEVEVLRRNGIQPFPFRNDHLTENEFDRYFIVGFPEESTDSSLCSSDQAGVSLRPVCVPVRPIADDVRANGRITLHIVDRGSMESLVGLSGGPVFAIRQDGKQLQLYLLAIQSSWDERETAFACSIGDVFEDFRAYIHAQFDVTGTQLGPQSD
jgi:hypothetical protein